MGVAFLEQEPVAIRCFQSNERESTAELLPGEDEIEFSVAKTVFRGGVEVPNASAVPKDHRARAIIAVRDHRLEIEVFDRMILGMNREVLCLWGKARPLRDG